MELLTFFLIFFDFFYPPDGRREHAVEAEATVGVETANNEGPYHWTVVTAKFVGGAGARFENGFVSGP